MQSEPSALSKRFRRVGLCRNQSEHKGLMPRYEPVTFGGTVSSALGEMPTLHVLTFSATSGILPTTFYNTIATTRLNFIGAASFAAGVVRGTGNLRRRLCVFGRYTGQEQGRLIIDPRRLRLLAAIAAVVPFFLFVAPVWTEAVQRLIQLLGVMLIIVCIAGRTLTYICISQKTYTLMKTGPYALLRNPLYLFSMIGAVGAGAVFGALSFAAISGFAVTLVLYYRTLAEEQTLLRLHGDVYRNYMAEVPRFIPRRWSWQPVDVNSVRWSKVIRTFIDACLPLLMLPLAGWQHYLHAARIVPVIAWLP